METRRSRNQDFTSSRPATRGGMRMVKSTRIPSQELAKAVTQPMLVIPQPVLRIHECLDESVRLARIESNAYIALGIKEEPFDAEFDDNGRNYEEADLSSLASFSVNGEKPSSELSETDEFHGMRTTRSVKRKRLLGLHNQPLRQDANNNPKKQAKKRTRKQRVMEPEPECEPEPEPVSAYDEFNPIVLSTYTLATTGEDGLPISFPDNEYTNLQPVPLAESSLFEEECLGNNNIEFEKDGKSYLELHPEQVVPENSHEDEVLCQNSDLAKPSEQESVSDETSTIYQTQNREDIDVQSASSSSEKESYDVLKIMPVTEEIAPTALATDEEINVSKITDNITPVDSKQDEPQSGLIPSNYLPGHLENVSSEDDEKESNDSEEYRKALSSSSSSSDDSDDTFHYMVSKMWTVSEKERASISCNVCQKKFSRVSILKAHKKKHFDPNVYNCTHCNKVFSSESSYKHHIAYSGLAPFKCERCGKSYYTEQKAESHRAQCEGKNTERKFQCDQCERSYVMLCSLRTHIRERHSDFKPVKNLCCELCGKRFRHKKYLELHMYSHSSEKKFECDVCHRKYKSSDILRHHVRMVHKNLPRVTCEVCQKEVSRVSLKAHLNRHKEKAEEEEESARHLLSLTLAADSNAPSCRICTKYFESDKLLKMHACEGREGSYPCPYCSDSPFATAADLVSHVCQGLDNSKSRNSAKVYKCVFCCSEYSCHTPWLYHVRHHTNVKPYPCPSCDKSFRLKQGLKVHMRNHTGEKPFKCEQCPAAFKQKPFLLDHINTHTGNKPYQCQKCQARFSVRSALSTHKRIHRREQKRNAETTTS